MLGSAWLVPTFSGGGSSFPSAAPPCHPVHPAVPIGAVPGLGSGEAPGLCCLLALSARVLGSMALYTHRARDAAAMRPGSRLPWALRGRGGFPGSPGCRQWGHAGGWPRHLGTLVQANPCLRLPTGLGRAWGAAGSDAAGHPLPVHARLNFRVFPRTPVRVHLGRGACTRDARAPGSPRVLPCALAPARCSQMCKGSAGKDP